jgi:hypothetical protein
MEGLITVATWIFKHRKIVFLLHDAFSLEELLLFMVGVIDMAGVCV